MPIDLDGLAMIDTMLDALIELRLMPEIDVEQHHRDLTAIHEALLVINELWQEGDIEDTSLMSNIFHELRQPMNAVLGFSQVLKIGVDGRFPELALPQLNTLEMLANLLLKKTQYFYDKHKIRLGI